LNAKGGITLFLYTVIEAVIAVIAGILIAVCTKKADGVTYGKLDKIGQITNILLLLVYVGSSFLYLFLGMIANPRYDGFLGILGWIVSVVMASAALFCGIGLGLSVAFRKRGKSKLSFAVQFSGVAGIALTLILFFLFYGNLLRPIN
jgi:cytochrome bd-type quinol oxidase subunit 2